MIYVITNSFTSRHSYIYFLYAAFNDRGEGSLRLDMAKRSCVLVTYMACMVVDMIELHWNINSIVEAANILASNILASSERSQDIHQARLRGLSATALYIQPCAATRIQPCGGSAPSTPQTLS